MIPHIFFYINNSLYDFHLSVRVRYTGIEGSRAPSDYKAQNKATIALFRITVLPYAYTAQRLGEQKT